jgi:hypothetical protein
MTIPNSTRNTTSNVEQSASKNEWTFTQKTKHWVFGGVKVKTEGGEGFVYKYDGIGKRLAGVTIGLLPRIAGSVSRMFGVDLKPSTTNWFASREWKDFSDCKEEKINSDNACSQI